VSEDDCVPVLVVEDNANLRHALVLQLHALGIKADSAANGMEALRRVHDAEYALILMDVQMPVMNGLEATAAIRSFEESEQRRPVPIVAVTGGGSTKEKCLKAGMNAYYDKPMLLENLRELIAESAPKLLS
jgi:polar amino acid transport system substrate-binding protein